MSIEMTAERLDLVEVAKIVRKKLRAAWPGVKFSVRSSRYSGGSSIDVSWTDGPTDRQVRAITDHFEGADFDGMIDLKTYREPTLLAGEDGTVQLVRFGVDFIQTHRRESAAVLRKVVHEVAEYVGIPDLPEVKETSFGGHIEGAHNLHLGVSAHRNGFDKLGAGLALNDHRDEYFTSLCRALWYARDYSRACDHRMGTYPAGRFEDGRQRHRCTGCGMRTARHIEEVEG